MFDMKTIATLLLKISSHDVTENFIIENMVSTVLPKEETFFKVFFASPAIFRE